MRLGVFFLVFIIAFSGFMADTAFAATLGVKVSELSAQEAKKRGLEPGVGLKVVAVRDGYPAAKAGLKEGMVIISMDGMKIRSEKDLVAAIEKAGRKMKITVITEDGWEEDKIVVFQASAVKKDKPKPPIRDKKKPDRFAEEKKTAPDKSEEFTDEELAELEQELLQMRKRIGQILKHLRSKRSGKTKKAEPPVKKPQPYERARPKERERPKEPKETPKKRQPGKAFMGAELESAPEGEKGVEILRVLEGYAAHKAGLKQYDIILKVNGEAVNTVQELRGHIADAGVGGKLKMVIDRYGKIIEVEMTLGARPQETQ